jgi:hypothetical protein
MNSSMSLISKYQMSTVTVKLALCLSTSGLLHALVASDMRLGGLQSHSGHDDEEKSCPCWESKLRRPAHSRLTAIINIRHYF